MIHLWNTYHLELRRERVTCLSERVPVLRIQGGAVCKRFTPKKEFVHEMKAPRIDRQLDHDETGCLVDVVMAGLCGSWHVNGSRTHGGGPSS